MLYGLPDTLLKRLQQVQNAAARMLTKTPKREHITPILHELHWLPVSHRIIFKVIMIVFKAIHGLAPPYIEELVQQKPLSERSMRSDNQCLLLTSKARTVTYGDRNFRVYAPVLWNNLPSILRCCDSLEKFKRLLKTHMFKDAYK